MAVIKINKKLIDRPCFQFPSVISGGQCHTLRKRVSNSLLIVVPMVQTKIDEKKKKLSGERNNHRGIIVLYFVAVMF